ncbi:MAG TPA: endonuclease/exonuclease/phosphatase family protein [Chitinophagaceae bacterium]|nr:endonuclease/exonuclease/phosphatase family protein [Chitinophagaceae bacterium]
MSGKLRHFTKRLLVFANFFLAFLFLLACLAPFLNPSGWWFISFLGLAFPFLLFFLLVFLICWLFTKRKPALISLITLLIGFKSISVFFAFHISSSFHLKKNSGALRVATWNVARFIELKKNNNKGSQTRLKMMELIKQQDADVLCLQEFETSTLPDYYNNIAYIQQELNYPYYYFCFDDDGDNMFYSSVIFSRYPIIDSGFIRFPRPSLPEVLLHADIKTNNDTIRIYTTHLQSLQFRKSDYLKIDKIERVEDSLLSNSRTIFSKIKRGFINRSIQADIIHQVLGDSPYPVIYCSDMNDVPNSYTYFKVRGDMQDAFLKKGFGIGRTFNALSPTLRIDYIFTDKKFAIDQFRRIINNYSDHYMLVADIELKK